jgi:hypothetical protein
MYQEFNKLSGNAKIWVFNAGRQLTDKEKTMTMESAKNFCMQWKAHGKPLIASADIMHNQFLVLAVDESLSHVSGCSIDESVHFLREISEKLDADFLNRETVTFMDPQTGGLFSLPLKTAKEKARNGELRADLLVFNNLVLSKDSLKTNWAVPLKESWMKNLLHKKITL